MKTLPHPVAPEEVMALLDGELACERVEAIRLHVELCPECSEVAKAIEESRSAFATWPVEDLALSSATDIGSRVSERAEATSLKSGRSPAAFALAACAAVLLFLVATPNLLRSRIAANEASAVGSLRLLNTAALTYAEKYGHYPSSLENFGPPPSGDARESAANLIDSVLASGRKSGYVFSYKRLFADRGGDGYFIRADPLYSGQSGQRTFSTDQTGVLWMNGKPLEGPSNQNRGPASVSRDVANANSNGPKIEQTADLKVDVRSVEDARDAMSAILERHGGHIAQLSANAESHAQRVLVASLRVPSDRLSTCIAELRRLGRVTQESQTGQEVTPRYVDLNARLSNERKTEAKINEVIKNRAGNLKEVLEAESESARVRGEIERMEAEQKTMEERIEFATIAVTLSEEYRAELQSPAPTAGVRVRNALVDGTREAWESGLGLAIWSLSILPTAMLWTAILFLPARWGWRRWRVWSAA